MSDNDENHSADVLRLSLQISCRVEMIDCNGIFSCLFTAF